MQIAGIYKITNLKNQKIYIGESYDILNRWGEHINNAFLENQIEYNYPLQKDIRENGILNFTFEILEANLYDNKIRKEKEYYYIKKYDGYSKGYNQNQGFEKKEKNSKRRSWSEEEVEILKKLIKEKLSQKEIAERLNRTKQSVNTKISRLKIGPRTENPWTKEKEKQMLELRNQGFSQKEVGEKLNFSKEAVKKRWHDKFSDKEGVWR